MKQSAVAALYLDATGKALCAFVSKCVFTCLLEVDVNLLNRAALHPLKSSYKGQIVWAHYTGGREMKVSQPSAEPINLCLNEATHLSPCALTTAHRSPPSHHMCTHKTVTMLQFWVTDVRGKFTAIIGTKIFSI